MFAMEDCNCGTDGHCARKAIDELLRNGDIEDNIKEYTLYDYRNSCDILAEAFGCSQETVWNHFTLKLKDDYSIELYQENNKLIFLPIYEKVKIRV
jgi:hypothetical protein